jgi:hypothetical protein
MHAYAFALCSITSANDIFDNFSDFILQKRQIELAP